LFAAFFSLLLSSVVFGVFYYLQYPLTAVVDLFLPLSVTAVTFAFVASTLLYIRSRFCRTDELTPGGNTGMSTIINQIFNVRNSRRE
jgi:hypothetical protein